VSPEIPRVNCNTNERFESEIVAPRADGEVQHDSAFTPAHSLETAKFKKIQLWQVLAAADLRGSFDVL
jgi:hypothetical protein